MATQVGKSYLLGEFQLESETRSLSRHGVPVHLTHKPFQTLLYLIENRDRFVSRAELLECFWQGKEVYDVTLSKCIGAIRKALDDQADKPRFIQTRWAEGYRYIGPLDEQVMLNRETFCAVERTPTANIIAEVETLTDPGAASPATVANAGQSSGKRLSALKPQWLVIGLAVSVIVLTLAILAFTGGRTDSNASLVSPIRSIAVLPLKNLTGDATQDYFSDGVTESLISELSKINGLKVISRSSVFTYKNKEVDPRDIGKRMGVATVLEGSVRRNEDSIRVEVRLVSADDGHIIWTGDSQSRPLQDILAVQDDIGCSVATELRVRLCGDDNQALARQGTNNIEAYQAYLKARYYLNQRTGAGTKKALDYFQQAIALDRRYAPAYAGLSQAYSLGMWSIPLPSKEATEKAKAAALQALEIDDSLSEAHHAISAVYAQEWNWAASKREIERAIALNPGDARLHHGYALFLNCTKQPDEAITEIKRAQELDPLSIVINTDVGLGYFFARRYDEALEALLAALELDPNFSEAHEYLAWVYTEKGQYDQALEETDKTIALSERSPGMLMTEGYINARAGRRQKAQAILTELNKLEKQTYLPLYTKAVIYAALEQKDQAIECLERAFEQHSVHLINMAVDPMLDSLRSEPRFLDLLHRIGLSQ